MNTKQPSPPFYHRLVFRFAFLMALMMLLFDFVAETIHEAVFQALGVPVSFVVMEQMPLEGTEGVLSMVSQGVTPEMVPQGAGFQKLGADETGSLAIPQLLETLEFDGSPEMLDPLEAQRLQKRMRQIANITSWSTTLLVALLLGLILSRIITRRLNNLTRAMADFGTDMGNDPTAFDLAPLPDVLTQGRDEIAQLAQVFAASRGRIAKLIETLALRDRTRREWIAHASHDLRTPLTALSACLDRAEEITHADSSDQQADLPRVLATARQDCDRLHELTDDLLALARIETSDRFTPETLLAAELASRARSSLLPLAESKGIDLTIDTGETNTTSLSFDGDGKGILRVLENLLRNAIQHARVKVTVRVRRLHEISSPAESGDLPRHDGPPELARLTTDDQIIFEILDDGTGFQASAQQAPTSNGIGLRVARRFVELHGGRLETGDWEQGGRAAFSLPASASGKSAH